MLTGSTSSSLQYHEPGIQTILLQAGFLLLLNILNYGLDKLLYCGLLGQIFIGVAFGTPGAKWLGQNAETVIVQLGYLGLLLIVYEGGLSTSLKALKANIILSLAVAVTGICLPIGLSFILRSLTNASPIQSFAAGAALCSTSLGTTFTVLGTSGLVQSRLGVVLTSAAMMDDVVGLVMVEVISNLGPSAASIAPVTIVRPILVSLAFVVVAPLVCVFLVKPVTIWLNAWRTTMPAGRIGRLLGAQHTPFTIQTLILLGCITAAAYAGTSTLFAAYIAGASISWWDSELPHPENSEAATDAPNNTGSSHQVGNSSPLPCCKSRALNGAGVYEQYYMTPVNRVLRPLFFASIGFSIPIKEMFAGEIVWKGIVYTLLMMFGKICCGIWLMRITISPKPRQVAAKLLRKLPGIASCYVFRHKEKGGEKAKESTAPQSSSANAVSSVTEAPADSAASATANTDQSVPRRLSDRAATMPKSLYPASIIGCAMTARGEIGFLISSIAESQDVFASPSDTHSSSNIFLVVTWAIVLCTILGPLFVGLIVRRVERLQKGVQQNGRLLRSDVLGDWGIS